jgi:hypothetical protein
MARSKNKRANVGAARVKRQRTAAERARTFKESEKRSAERDWQERLAWLRRPRLHTAIFEKVWKEEEIAKIIKLMGVTQVFDSEAAERTRRVQEEEREEVQEIAKLLGWQDERLHLFKQLVVEYRRTPNIENYVRVRRQFPEVEIQVALFSGIDPLCALESTFKKQGIDPQLVAAALDGNEPSVDALCLRLLECLIARGNLPNTGPGHIEARRAAISDATVNYLIVSMMETFDWHEAMFRIPASLVVLIRHQLYGGARSDLDETYRSRDRFQNAAIFAGQFCHQHNKQISINKLAKMAHVGRSTAARWLAHEDFQGWFEMGRSLAAGEAFPRRLKEKPPKATP